ncbi:MAG: endonuclease/exonuclease/phosphatase family protein [Tenericutes bacterium]|nr:endonuclease/exonuclease/phosphatase family protein [Mycoplasmatota bacterium]
MLKIASWNIGEDELYKDNKLTKESYKYIKTMIIENNIDIICFQENIISNEYIKNNTLLKYKVDMFLSTSKDGFSTGISIYSKYPISLIKKVMFNNPNFKYKDKISYDRGFVFVQVVNTPLVICSGHALPFHVFNESPSDFKYIFDEMETEMINIFNDTFILTCDLNYENIEELFPKISKISNILKLENTYKNKQVDHILVSKNIQVLNSKVIKTRFDHNICICDLEI